MLIWDDNDVPGVGMPPLPGDKSRDKTVTIKDLWLLIAFLRRFSPRDLAERADIIFRLVVMHYSITVPLNFLPLRKFSRFLSLLPFITTTRRSIFSANFEAI